LKEFYTKQDIDVQWTGSYPNLCSGLWEIRINGILLIDHKNTEDGSYNYESFLRRDMGTENQYSSWYFDGDYSECWDDYYQGDAYKQWIVSEKGRNILELLGQNNVILSEADLINLYNQINSKDWRHSSCGGCI